MKAVRYISFLFLISFLGAKAQNEMLIEQLSDRMVIRENFEKKGVLLNTQTFKVGKIKENEGFYEIEVVTELFDKNRESKGKYATKYICKPNESSVMVMAFPFAEPKTKETKINTTSKKFKELYDLGNLEDIKLEMSFDSGLLNFFGSKSVINIYDRKLDVDQKNIQITSKINIKAYALGLRIKELNYSVNEKLNSSGLLSFQKFTEEDGSYFTMTYKRRNNE